MCFLFLPLVVAVVDYQNWKGGVPLQKLQLLQKLLQEVYAHHPHHHFLLPHHHHLPLHSHWPFATLQPIWHHEVRHHHHYYQHSYHQYPSAVPVESVHYHLARCHQQHPPRRHVDHLLEHPSVRHHDLQTVVDMESVQQQQKHYPHCHR